MADALLVYSSTQSVSAGFVVVFYRYFVGIYRFVYNIKESNPKRENNN
jgi:hypothetical protein